MARKQQSELLKAVINDNLKDAKHLLASGIDPNFITASGLTLLWEAIRNNSLKMVRMLVHYGADVNLADTDCPLPLDYAESHAAVTTNFDIVNFLKSKGAVSCDDLDDDGFPAWMNLSNDEARDGARRIKLRVVRDEPETPKKEPAFTAEKLKDIFKPEAWVGKIPEMDKLWDTVPARLKKNFDFAAKRAEASRQTLKKGPKGPKMPPQND